MKHLFIFIIIIAFAVPCSAQWHNASMGAQVLAFGVHDSSLYIGINPDGTPAPLIWRLVSVTPNVVWVISDTGLDRTKGNVTSFASLGTYLFASQYSNRLVVSSNNGSSWGLGNATGPVASNGKYLFGGLGSSLARSVDTDKTWTRCIPPNPNNVCATGACIFANNDTGVWRSTDTGNDWSQINPPFTGTMTVMGSLLFIVSNTGKLAESTDSGTQWSMVSVDSAGVPETVNCVATDENNLFVGTPTGVLVSIDTGKDWIAKNDSIAGFYRFPNATPTVDVMQISVFDTLLFADVLYTPEPGASSSYYLIDCPISELTKTDSPASVVQALPSGDTIEVYPNPAAGIVTILSGGTSILGVSVLNVLGEAVLNLPNLRESDISLDISKIPSGTYFLRIETANGIILRKIVKEE
jgi:hypothetical protein